MTMQVALETFLYHITRTKSKEAFINETYVEIHVIIEESFSITPESFEIECE